MDCFIVSEMQIIRQTYKTHLCYCFTVINILRLSYILTSRLDHVLLCPKEDVGGSYWKNNQLMNQSVTRFAMHNMAHMYWL